MASKHPRTTYCVFCNVDFTTCHMYRYRMNDNDIYARHCIHVLGDIYNMQSMYVEYV